MAKIEAAQKSAKMSEIGVNFHLITQAERDVHALKVQAAPAIKAVVDSFGPGPHKMSVPTGSIDPSTNAPTFKDVIVNFRKSGDTFHVSAVDADSIT